MNVVSMEKRKTRQYIDAETRADLIRAVRANSAVLPNGRRELLVRTGEIAKEHNVRAEYVRTALHTLRVRDAKAAEALRIEEEKRKAQEEISEATRQAREEAEAQAAPTQQEPPLGVYSTVPSEPDMVAARPDKLESMIELALDRLDRPSTAVATLNEKWA